MADMTTRLMLDDTDVSILQRYAGSADAVAGYVNGSFANWDQIVALWGTSGKHLISIDVQNKPSAAAQCRDIEAGDATMADAPGWFTATQAAGKAARDLR